MERDMSDMNQPAVPTLCRGGCGFYGSGATDNLCSKCFKDTLKRKQDPGRLSPPASTSSVTKSDSSSTTLENDSPTTSTSCLTGAPLMMNVDVPSMIQNALNEKIAAAAAASSNETTGDTAKQYVEEEELKPPVDVNIDNEKKIEQPPPSAEKKSNRCSQCRKKVGFTGFECRCGGLYCAVHRYSDMHQCTFDYKALGAAEIRKNNPVVKNEKIQKL